jgi:hypothetical protein
MAGFSKGVPRWAVLSLILTIVVAVPPEALALGPDLCVWKHLFHLAACPACGSTRALAAFFHGHIAQALRYNRNVMVTGPVLLTLWVRDAADLVTKEEAFGMGRLVAVFRGRNWLR